MIVVDASVVVKWFVPEQGSPAARPLLQQGQTFVAPDFIILETLNVLRRKYKRGDVAAKPIEGIAGALHNYFYDFVPATSLAQQAMDLAIKLDHPVYDCAYLACALQRSVTFLTADDAFYRKAAVNGFKSSVSPL